MLKELITRYKQLSICQSDIQKSADALIACYNTGGKVLTCGNGGSCADCDHIVGELMKGFLKNRPLTSTQKENMLKNAPLLDVELLNKL